MSTAPVRYGNFGLNTVASLYWAAVVSAGFAVWVVATEITMSGKPVLLTVGGYIWIICVFVAMVRVLKRLSKLEEEHREPDEAMKLAFHCAAVIPVLGFIGFVLGLAL